MPAPPERKAASSSPSPRKRKRGRRPYVPSPADKQRVSLAVAAGLTLKEISAAIDLPVRSVSRTFAEELASGRAKVLMEALVLLRKSAIAGNVSAQRTIVQICREKAPGTAEEPANPWAAIEASYATEPEARPNLAQKSEFGKWEN
jgi:hypothetical protein